MWAKARETGEEDIDGYLQPGLCQAEYVFGGERGKGFDEVGEGNDEENEEGAGDGGRDGAD